MPPHTGIGTLQERAGEWQHRTLVYSVTICKMSKKKKKKTKPKIHQFRQRAVHTSLQVFKCTDSNVQY